MDNSFHVTCKSKVKKEKSVEIPLLSVVQHKNALKQVCHTQRSVSQEQQPDTSDQVLMVSARRIKMSIGTTT
jgi:hypothetical protein